ncbi:NeuD/PglB/VioB family sugar acetyltransferase [Ramlibacter sp.]|uniref:NeuD/PglB/VioB family sugar acetyltransferase n=1 Tax=Ramlibacter sp. TaxID=1917967 RepID=UPI002CFDC1B7|nr:NeuD/PglB/VioB family sugar acetyltransferase [Ramlibacter sp.]HWI81358.1 NeuD/PglB/VioB family sugar acetyltransferase [Ramlibacter sp.]
MKLEGLDSVSTLLIFGAGGHGRVVADAALASGGWSRVIATDRDPQRCRGELLPGVALLPVDEAAALADAVHIAIGDAASRRKEAGALGGKSLATVVHPRASVAGHASVGPGCFVAAQAVVAPGARLGRAVIVNHGAVVDHDVQVGDFCHIAPLAALGGAVDVGSDVLVGSGATVLPRVRVGSNVVIGAGAAVCGNLPAAGRYAGVPARRLK